ncbi:hypothetical protein NIES23_00880 [Trichormus variabilis NIES-23]|uniref:Uncharacterized protein n=1 Tax=Trichormus variabilis NIES-23 TaxID=1973479 RepID=A0A1Z4KEC6_ANAVA|nr:hypothetical protein NIES23_00880 [Trichormus variabilis NIES-23]
MSLTDDLLQALKLTLPDNNVNIVVAYPGSGGDGPSYVDLTISNGNFLNGLYDTYCIDANQTIVPGQSYQAQVYSSYNDPLPTGIIDKPENLDEINWLINQKFVGKQSSGGLGAYTSGDIQVAIWTLLENTVPSNILGTVGAYNQNRANQIVEAAFQNGGGFVPGISQDGIPQDIGIIVVPVNQTGTNIAQSTINILKTAALGDFVWEDLNANGVQDANEAGVEGVTVTLTGGGKDGVIGTADDTNVTTTTDANGSYLFPLLLPGVEYKVTFSNLPTGFVFTQSNQGNDTTDSDADPLTGQAQIIELNPNEFNRTIDAGIYRKASLGDFVFKDANNNGIQDAGEVGVGQVTVELINPTNGDVIATTTTNSSGGYQFSGLTPGNYQVRFTAPTGYIFSTANQGSNDELDSDANPSTGLTQTLTLTSGEFNGTLDAGLVPLASLGNFVFEDKNANGIQDAGETGIGNATVNLLDAAENIIATATTDDNGLYSFTNLRPGDYKVQFVQPNGFNGVSPQNVGGNDAIDSDGLVSDIVNLSPGENDTTVDAGFYKTASLGDFVFKDANNNGIQDAGEVGVGQVTVELINPTNGDVIATTTTNSSGGYQFSGLTPGNYQVRFTAPTGYIFSTANQGSNDELDSDANPSTGLTQTLTLASGEFNGTLDAGLVPLASLGNFVFEDKNANGIQDAGETGIGDATVKLLDTSGNVIATTTTDGNGLYSFTNLQPGDYKVQFIQPSGFDGISPKNVGGNDAIDSDGLISDVVNLSPGENDTTVDAGFYQTASLGDFVFNDVNNNGIQDAGEIGVGGVTVELINPANGDVIATTTTDANGGYGFSGLTPGEYQVKFTAPAGYNFSLANQGNNDALDSDANVSTGITQTLTLASGEFNGTLDAGLVPLASLGNFVFEDKNANGIQDAGETGIGDATVKLLDTSGNVIATTTTDGNGLYSFTNLRPGDYKVQFVQPNGFNGVSPQNVGGNDAIDSDGLISDVVNLSPGENDTTVDAGFYKTASLGDFVFNDVNNNGIQDAGEVGVAGVSVTLTGGGADGIINGIGDTTVTTTTNAGGNYNFAELTPGQQYQVGFSGLPAGFQFTQANVGANDVVDSDANPSTGKTQVVTLVSGENNLTLDAGIYQNAGDLSITKTDGLTNVTPGQQITYTIVARNNGLITATNALVSDIIPSNLTNVTWTSVASGGATDNQASGTGNINDHVTLTGGSSITYTVTGTVVSNAASTGSSTRFDFDGNSPLDGTDGNTRTFTQNGITVTARAFSRVDGTNGAWSAAYLGSYTGGLGVTDSSEGNGGNNTHVVDNVGGRDNYVLFQFSEAVVLDKAYLQYVLKDSDISVWIGNFNNPLTNLSDSTLNSFGFYEANVTNSSSDRWADVNAGNYVGNTIVIAALDTDTSPEDNFKIRYLDVLKATPVSLVNTATITAPNGFTDTNPSNNSATDTNTVIAAPGVRTPDFWANTEWQKFWDGNQGNEPTQKTLTSDLLFAPYTNSAQSGKVLDPVTGQYHVGLLIGDFNRNGITDAGEDTLFYTLNQARQIVNSSAHPNADKRYDLGRSLVASWLNYVAGNPIDTANATDKDARYYIKEGINWLQALTPDENGDKKGDGAIHQMTGSSVTSPGFNDTWWSYGISSASSLPNAYKSNTNVSYGIDAGTTINSNLEHYNNGLGLADHVFSGGNA